MLTEIMKYAALVMIANDAVVIIRMWRVMGWRRVYPIAHMIGLLALSAIIWGVAS